MSTDFYIRRIPLIFIIPASQSKVGKIYNSTSSSAEGGEGMSSDVKAAGFAQPAITATMNGLNKLSEIAAQGSLAIVGKLTNKIIIPMYVNPSSIQVTKNSKVVKTLTKRGQINQYFTAEPDQIRFSGIAGGQKSFLILNQLDVLLKSIETGTRNIITMVYKYGGIYKGIIENFTINSNADNPNIFNYEFNFNFIDQNHFRLFLLAIRPGSLNQAIQNPGNFVKETLKISANDLINPTGISWKK